MPPVIVDLGVVTPDADFDVEIPAGALGFQVVVRADASVSAGVERVTSPSGVVVHDAYGPVGGDYATSVSQIASMAAVSVPMNEMSVANPPEPGTWKVRFGHPLGDGPATLHAEAVIQTGPAAGFAGGRLDLDIHIPAGLRLDGRMLSAANAGNDPAIEERLEAFFDATTTHFGIERGDVRFHDAPNDLVSIDEESRMLAAFAVSAGLPRTQSLHVLFTTAIDFGDGNAAWGLAPSVPGAPMTAGTPLSGVIVAIGEASAEDDAIVMLHEAGHFFGLSHTTELDGVHGDPLSDTARCTIIDQGLTSLYDCPDVNNFMFPTIAWASAHTSSPSQGAVFRGSAVYKAYATAGKSKKTTRKTLAPARRPRSAAEAWLAATICPHARALGVPPFPGTADELRAAANDPTLPGPLRRRAAGLVAK